MAQTGYGRINIFEDFLAGEDIVAEVTYVLGITLIVCASVVVDNITILI